MSEKWILKFDAPARASSIVPPSLSDDDALKIWLEEHAATGRYNWLLAHFDDGVLWGRIDNGVLQTSSQVAHAHEDDPEVKKALDACPKLRFITLQEARLFSEQAELLLWRDGDNAFHARRIENTSEENGGEWTMHYDEAQLLWGTHGMPLSNDFTLLWDGAQGLRHIVPIRVVLNENKKIHETKEPLLFLRHYLNRESDGMARVVVSRILKIDDKE